MEKPDQPFNTESLGDSEDADLVPIQSGEDWVAQLVDDLSRPASQAGELFGITFPYWGSFGPEPHVGPPESPVLLVGYGRRCTTCRHHPLGNIPSGHGWDRIAIDILDVCESIPDGYRYILVIADYFSKWTEAFPIKDKCADTVADVLVNKIILRFGMPLVIHSDQGREFENGLMNTRDVIPGMSVSLHRASNVFWLCCDPRTQTICHLRIRKWTRHHRFPDKSFLDS